MSTLIVAVLSFLGFIVAYHTYGRWLARKVFCLSHDVEMPSQALRDDIDYVPTRKGVVFGHHFTSIAGTGPIVGPALAVFWGWLPALIWVVVGSIFIGAVHDFGSLVLSIRNRGQSLGEVAGREISARARLLFLFVLALLLTIVLAVIVILSCTAGAGAVAVFAGDAPGKGGLILWPVFGASNQLLEGLAFLVIVSYLLRHGKPVWFAIGPMIIMLVMPGWAMIEQMSGWYAGGKWWLFGFGVVVWILLVWMLLEAVLVWISLRNGKLSLPKSELAVQPADPPAESE